MRQTLDAVYENGVFKPLDSPGISEGQTVRLIIEIASGRKVYASYEEVHEGSVWEGEVTEDLAPLAGVLSKLSNHVPA